MQQQQVILESIPQLRPRGLGISCTSEDELFDTHFPRPPPRFSGMQAERLAHPSFPLPKHRSQIDSLVSSQDTSHKLSTSVSTGSTGSFSSYPSSTSSLSLLHSRFPSQQNPVHIVDELDDLETTDVSSAEVNDTGLRVDTAHSSSLEPSEASTPVTPNSAAHTWRPKELNLVKKQTESYISELAQPMYATPMWCPFESKQFTDSPDISTIDIAADIQTGSSSGPKKLLLSSSGGPPTNRRFSSRRPSDSVIDLALHFTHRDMPSSGYPVPSRSPLPVLPNTPTFTAVALRSTDFDYDANTSASLTSAKEFVARIASQPEYQVSEHIDTVDPLLFPLPPSDEPAKEAKAETLLGLHEDPTAGDFHVDLDKPSYEDSATSNFGRDYDDHLLFTETPPSPVNFGREELGISLSARSRAHSFSRRKAPPSPLALAPNVVSSPATPSSSLDQVSPTSRTAHNLSHVWVLDKDDEKLSLEQSLPTAFFDCEGSSDTTEQHLIALQASTRRRSSCLESDMNAYSVLTLSPGREALENAVSDVWVSIQGSASGETPPRSGRQTLPVFDTEIFKTQPRVTRQRHSYAYCEIDPIAVEEESPRSSNAMPMMHEQNENGLSEAYKSSRSVSSPFLPADAMSGNPVSKVDNDTQIGAEKKGLRKSDLVPVPPSFTIRGASPKAMFSADRIDSIAEPDFPYKQSMPSQFLAQSRWSSGSETDVDATKGGGNNSFSLNRKSLSSSRKSSFAQARDSASSRNSSQDNVERSRLSMRGSRKSSSSAPMPKATLASAPKRPLLSSFTSFRKKSFSKVSSQPVTPLSLTTSHEFPFANMPSSKSGGNSFIQIKGSHTAPLSDSRTSDRQSGFNPTSDHQPLSTSSAPLTTQQILAHAQSNVWPADYFGSGVRSHGLLDPNPDDNAASELIAPRAAPRPPMGPLIYANDLSLRLNKENTNPFNTRPRAGETERGFEKDSTEVLQPTPARSNYAVSLRDLRHLRQTCNASSRGKERELPKDLFKPTTSEYIPDTKVMSIDSNLHADKRLSAELSSGERAISSVRALLTSRGAQDVGSRILARSSSISLLNSSGSGPRSRNKRHKCCKHFNSWSEFGLRWITGQAGYAYDTLLAEPSPFKAALQVSGDSIVAAGGGDGGDDDNDGGSDTDDYGSSDGGGGTGGGGYGEYRSGGNDSDSGGDDDEDSDEQSDDSDSEEELAGSSTDDESEENYVQVNNRLPKTDTIPPNEHPDTDSSDDRPLGQLVSNPHAVQRALRLQERRRHFDLAHKALNGEANSINDPSGPSETQSAEAPGPIDVVDLNKRLARVQKQKDRINAAANRPVERSLTLEAHTGVSKAERASTQGKVMLRSKSVRHQPSDRHIHAGLRHRTPSEAALRSKAMAQTTSDTRLHLDSTIASQAPLPPYAIATVTTARKALALAQVKASPATIAQSQEPLTSAALDSASLSVNNTLSSPVSAAFGKQTRHQGDFDNSPRPDHSARSREVDSHFDSRAGVVGPRLQSRSTSQTIVPPAINTTLSPSRNDFSPMFSPTLGSLSPQSTQPPPLTVLTSTALHDKRNLEGTSVTRGAEKLSLEQSSSSRYGEGQRTIIHRSPDGAASVEPCLPVKVYILSRQRFTTAAIPVSSRARDLVLNVVEREHLPMDTAKGGWVVFDCSQQFGIERPLREYEIVNEIINVQAKPGSDYLLLKHTELSPYLCVRSLPLSSPELAGYVYVQDRKKKWNKRWLELRDHGLYHARNERGKDEVFICQISTFDVYLVDPSLVKMPKPAGFALRSQDKISMFEKPDQDYVHYFSLTDPAAHRDWVRAILNARSYVLRQEKAVLFQTEKADANVAPSPASANGISRRPTAKALGSRLGAEESSHGRLPLSPLIDRNAFAGPFVKGSLLADKAISDVKEALRAHPSPAISGALNDLSLAEREAVLLNEIKRKEAAFERHKQAQANGQPLLDLSHK